MKKLNKHRKDELEQCIKTHRTIEKEREALLKQITQLCEKAKENRKQFYDLFQAIAPHSDKIQLIISGDRILTINKPLSDKIKTDCWIGIPFTVAYSIENSNTLNF